MRVFWILKSQLSGVNSDSSIIDTASQASALVSITMLGPVARSNTKLNFLWVSDVDDTAELWLTCSGVNATAESWLSRVFCNLKEYLGEFAAVCENILGCEPVV